jgi:hypothetical protein
MVMNSNKLAAIVALALSAGLAGCMGQSEPGDDTTEGQDEVAAAPADQANDVNKEKTGEATQKCGFGGWGGFGGCGGWGGWGGFGGCGGCGGWGGWGGGCGGWGGWGGGCGGWGGFGGCGGW